MTYALSQIAPAPHLLEPSSSVESSRRYYLRYATSAAWLKERIAEQKRALAHEQAILEGMGLALKDLERGH